MDGVTWATTQPWQLFQMANLAPAVHGARLEDSFPNNEGK